MIHTAIPPHDVKKIQGAKDAIDDECVALVGLGKDGELHMHIEHEVREDDKAIGDQYLPQPPCLVLLEAVVSICESRHLKGRGT